MCAVLRLAIICSARFHDVAMHKTDFFDMSISCFNELRLCVLANSGKVIGISRGQYRAMVPSKSWMRATHENQHNSYKGADDEADGEHANSEFYFSPAVERVGLHGRVFIFSDGSN